MSISDSLDSWFVDHLRSLPQIPRQEDSSLESSIYLLLEDLPFGVTEYNVPYRNIPFKRSGCSGWTYFPINETGSRLARVSYRSPKPNVFIKAMVKLVDYETDGDNVTCVVDERAVLTFDNLTGHGETSMRGDKQANKRQKIHVKH